MFDENGDPLGCGVLIEPGISAACAVVKNGGGGVLKGDIALVATADGSVFTGSNDDDGVMIILFHPSTPLDPNAPISVQSCLDAVNGGTEYYENTGELGGGNISWFED